MKKIITFMAPIVLFLAFANSVYAAGTVSTLNAAATTDTVEISGTTAGVNAAVTVQLLDAESNILAMDSVTVIDNAFSDTITGLALTEGAQYTVRVADYDGGTWKVEEVTARQPVVSVSSVSLSPTTGTLTAVGNTLQLTATVTPANATNKQLSWRTDKPEVVTVDAQGLVTAVAKGTATITVTTEDGNKIATATISVVINEGGNAGGNVGTPGNQTSSQTEEVKQVKVNLPIEYIVVRGDTLNKIAYRNHMSLKELLAMNPQITNPNRIYVGQKIVIGYIEKTVTGKQSDAVDKGAQGAGEFYMVRRGDSLYKIAKMHKMTLNNLYAMNPQVVGKRYIYAGQKIRVK